MKKASYDFQKEAESYFSWTPHAKIWFEFLTWLTALSTLQFLVTKTDSKPIFVIYIVSYAVFFNHLQKTLWSIKFQHYLPDHFSPKTKKAITYIVAVLLVGLVYAFIGIILDDLGKSFGL